VHGIEKVHADAFFGAISDAGDFGDAERDVFEARIVVGRQILSSMVKISIFDSISSGTASMTRSAWRRLRQPSRRIRCARKRVGFGGVDFAEFHGLIEVGADFSLGLAQGIRQKIFENGAITARRQRARCRDP